MLNRECSQKSALVLGLCVLVWSLHVSCGFRMSGYESHEWMNERSSQVHIIDQRHLFQTTSLLFELLERLNLCQNRARTSQIYRERIINDSQASVSFFWFIRLKHLVFYLIWIFGRFVVVVRFLWRFMCISNGFSAIMRFFWRKRLRKWKKNEWENAAKIRRKEVWKKCESISLHFSTPRQESSREKLHFRHFSRCNEIISFIFKCIAMHTVWLCVLTFWLRCFTPKSSKRNAIFNDSHLFGTADVKT